MPRIGRGAANTRRAQQDAARQKGGEYIPPSRQTARRIAPGAAAAARAARRCEAARREVAAYHKREADKVEESLSVQATHLWEIVSHHSCHVHAQMSLASSYLGVKHCNSIIYGQAVGEWLALTREPGFVRRCWVGKDGLRLMKDLVLTIHVGPLGPDGSAEALCTTMSGEEVAMVHVARDDPIGDLRSRVTAELLCGDFHMILSDGSVLSDDSIPMADVLGEIWAGTADGDTALEEEFMV